MNYRTLTVIKKKDHHDKVWLEYTDEPDLWLKTPSEITSSIKKVMKDLIKQNKPIIKLVLEADTPLKLCVIKLPG